MVPKGKPSRADKPAESKTDWITTRVSSDLFKKLGAAAKDHDQSKSEEIQSRLAASFQLEEDRAKLFDSLGGKQNYEAFVLIAELMRRLKVVSGLDWKEDQWVCNQLAAGAAELLTKLGPGGKPKAPPLRKEFPGETEDLGKDLAGAIHLFS